MYLSRSVLSKFLLRTSYSECDARSKNVSKGFGFVLIILSSMASFQMSAKVLGYVHILTRLFESRKSYSLQLSPSLQGEKEKQANIGEEKNIHVLFTRLHSQKRITRLCCRKQGHQPRSAKRFFRQKCMALSSNFLDAFFLLNNRTRKETIGTSSPKDRLDGQVLCPSLLLKGKQEHRNRKDPTKGESSHLSLAHHPPPREKKIKRHSEPKVGMRAALKSKKRKIRT
jgi:hypothetical protein